MKHWYVIMFPPKSLDDIKKVIEEEEFDIEIYCPMVQAKSSHNGVINIKEIPMMFNYMFFRYDREILTDAILKEYMPVRVLMISGEARTVRHYQIEFIKLMERGLMNSFHQVRNDEEYIKRFIGWEVVVKDGGFSGLSGEVVGVRKAGVIMVELYIFNRPIVCDLGVDYVEFVQR